MNGPSSTGRATWARSPGPRLGSAHWSFGRPPWSSGAALLSTCLAALAWAPGTSLETKGVT
eukprot:2685952-Alexandrium_andersonii.AAC.1